MSVSSCIIPKLRMSCPFLEATASLAFITVTKPGCQLIKTKAATSKKPISTLVVSPLILFPAYINIIMSIHLHMYACGFEYAMSVDFPGHKLTYAKNLLFFCN